MVRKTTGIPSVVFGQQQAQQPRYGLGSLLGETLGGFAGGLGTGIQALAQSKLQQMQQRQLQEQQAPIFKSLGLPEGLGMLEPSVQREFIKQKLLAPQREAQGSILQQLGLPPEVGMLPAPVQSAVIKRMLPQAEQAQLEDLIASIGQGGVSQTLLGTGEQPSLDVLPQQDAQMETQSALGGTPQAIMQQQQIPTKEPVTLKETQKQIKDFGAAKPLGYELAPMAKSTREIEGLRNALSNPNLSSLDKSKIRQEVTRRQEKFEKHQEQVDKTTEGTYSKINEDADGAKEGNLRLTRMLDLVNSGQLVGSTLGAMLETAEHLVPALGVGINLFGLTSPETQEFKKLQIDFLRDAKKVFGARVTNQEIQTYLQRLPSLTQSDEGKRRVIRDLMSFNNASLVKKNSMDAIIKENGGFRPPHIDRLVEERAKPELDSLAQAFKEVTISQQELRREYEKRKSPVGRLVRGVTSLFG